VLSLTLELQERLETLLSNSTNVEWVFCRRRGWLWHTEVLSPGLPGFPGIWSWRGTNLGVGLNYTLTDVEQAITLAGVEGEAARRSADFLPTNDLFC
jgi:hypothetical protein